MKKIILFDLDGTLIDSTPAIVHSFNTAFTLLDKDTPDINKLKSLIGHTLEDMFVMLGVRKDEVNNYVDAYRQAYHKVYLEQTTLIESAKEALKEAYSFADLGVVTTKGSLFLPNLLKHLGVFDYFKVLIGKNDVTYPKPNPEPINLALSRLNSSEKQRENTFMIGDTPLDIQAANSANVTALSVLCGYCDFSILSQYNDKIFKNPLEAVLFAKEFGC
ncbi:HAD family hydrolase [Campylobacter mucosalis]|uniref:HAD family hydrolase n=1 Tax=Campylobacter mucosalis TaxID=202 RepID=UPI0014700FF2|nr:HAD family hydrolase [Campylobacter mucosalis]